MPPLTAPFAADSASRYAQAFAALPLAAQYGFAIVIGLVIGSFLTVVVHRLPIMLERAWRAEVNEANAADASTGPDAPGEPAAVRASDAYPARFNLAVPHSACPHCGHTLRAWENIPVLSYLVLRGKCAQCGARVSARYPLLELATGALAALSLYCFGASLMSIAAFGLCATLLAASMIDFDTRYLPDTLTLPLLWAGLIVNLGEGGFVSLRDAVIGAMAGYVFLWAIYWIFRLVRGVEGMGYGDFKLLAALGAWLGWAALPQVVLVSAVAGALIGLLATWRGRMRFEEPLPFGPFLALGGAITLFFGTPFYAIFG